jgi:hypothetical protein
MSAPETSPRSTAPPTAAFLIRYTAACLLLRLGSGAAWLARRVAPVPSRVADPISTWRLARQRGGFHFRAAGFPEFGIIRL